VTVGHLDPHRRGRHRHRQGQEVHGPVQGHPTRPRRRHTLEEATRTGTSPVEIARLRSAKGSVKWTPSTLIASPQRLILAVIKQGRTTVSVQRVTAINLKAVGKASKKPVKQKGK
jgi:hypothetical protein